MTKKIGYGSPPVHSQFQPGRSGNPKGRPPAKADAIRTLVGDTLEEPVSYSERGRSKVITKAELLIKKLIRQALKGDHKAAAQLIEAHAQAKAGDAGGGVTIVIEGWLPDHPGQTGADKSEKYRAANGHISPSASNVPGGSAAAMAPDDDRHE